MKSTSLNTRVVKAISVTVAAFALFIGNPLTSQANGGRTHAKKTAKSEDQVSVHYLGTNDKNIIFKVEFENPTADKFTLIIKNDNGEIVYSKRFNDAHFSKNVLFEKQDTDIHPTFVIRSGNSDIVRQFAVNNTVTENTVVTSL
jgi:hypothetical protein